MNRHARTLADLGELTAQWLEARIESPPGYEWGDSRLSADAAWCLPGEA